MPDERNIPLVSNARFMDDPHWADFIPEDSTSPAVRRAPPPHGDCTPLNVDAVASRLMPNGALGRMMQTYESRPGQVDMLKAVVRAFNAREHLMVEAGTGVGKSLAYIIPALEWSRLNDTPVIVSTATRNLQSQLAAHDIPQAIAALDADSSARPLKTALLKGRANYLCLRALDEINHNGIYALTPDEDLEFMHLVEWLHATNTGDLDTLDAPNLRAKLSCSGEDCAGRRCPFRRKCFVHKARARAQEADVVVANHALVLSEAGAQGSILPVYSAIIFDEAHDLENVATDCFSFEFSRATLAALLGRVSRQSRRNSSKRGIVGRIDYYREQGLLGTGAFLEEMKELALKLEVARRNAYEKGMALLDAASGMLTPDAARRRIRYRRRKDAGVADRTMRQYAVNGLFADYAPHQWDEAALDAAAVKFEGALAAVTRNLVQIAATLAEAQNNANASDFSDLEAQVREVAELIRQYLLDSVFVLSGMDDAHVFWIERMGQDVTLTAAPVSVAQQLYSHFYDTKDTVILTSATLRVRGKFSYSAKRLGLSLVQEDRLQCCVAASPFDYLRQTLTLAVSAMPHPDAVEYCAQAADLLADLFAATAGRALALFTSYEMMLAVRDLAQAQFAARGLTLLVQGDGLAREEMARRLVQARGGRENVVLFGTQSFWEGVDVPGEALSCVAIVRIPFPQRAEPVCEARCEVIDAAGGSSFHEYMMSEAEIMLRQGFGRLVRRKDDRGVVVILDPRLVTKSYGQILRKALPSSVIAVPDAASAIVRVKSFFS
ncbi:MAG: hypothetical protein IJ802_05265 [Kiritimatiellae bacterium]|nr:hypothetical protein [Kiritimatiellia bacterium]